MTSPIFRASTERTERGAVYPSAVVMLSIAALVMASVAFLTTRDAEPTEREVTAVTNPAPAPSATPEPRKTATPEPKPSRPPVRRGKIYVEVYNNSGISGLASGVGARTTDAGWQVVGTDNWVGTIPENTVYHPPRLQRAAKLLALDLGIDRVMLAVDPMKQDRLTVILTGELS